MKINIRRALEKFRRPPSQEYVVFAFLEKESESQQIIFLGNVKTESRAEKICKFVERNMGYKETYIHPIREWFRIKEIENIQKKDLESDDEEETAEEEN